MERVLLPSLYHYVKNMLPSEQLGVLTTLLKFSDLTTPAEWFPAAREMRRKIYLHVGPTNSGKTYHALQRLRECQSGVYLGPLRLLAHEVYQKLNDDGIPCNLVTGEERKESDGVDKCAATVEMAPLQQRMEVGVVDEIQMLGDESRGWAWTQAVLGLQVDELHLCGEPTAVPLLERLFESTGETVEIKNYNRLTPLAVEKSGLDKNIANIKEGDCLVTFSRQSIFAFRRKIETIAKMKAAVVYGNLPPEIRAEQARLFNDPKSEYNVLVASDAIGMGLNLNIRRVIFEAMEKFDGVSTKPLTVSQIKQIAGRAGRFNTNYASGTVTTLKNSDMARLREVMALTDIPALTSAGLTPQFEQIEVFANELPNETLGGLLEKFGDLAQVNTDYFLCNLLSQKQIADLIETLPLSLRDKFTLTGAPCNVEDGMMQSVMLRFAKDLADGEECFISDMVKLPEEPPKSPSTLRELEGVHKCIILYLWLSFRFPTVFTDRDIAMHLKRTCEDLINTSLNSLHSGIFTKRPTKIVELDVSSEDADDGSNALGVSDER
ncbi:hypothetical protein HDU97_006070 [Phlyctochytrium planicorne]|nr:hypothetical protein HDU97_006070 [Phlyctochytrium planicorne]